MKIIGLTGSIGMGKTTTAQMFKDLGYPVFDADATVHQLYGPGGAAVPLIKAVFPDAVTPDGAVDRTVLGQHMRADPLNLSVLESFIHPMVQKAREHFIAKALRDGAPLVIFDIPLLFETGGADKVDVILVVTASYAVQKKRVMARPGMTEAHFKTLLARQMPDAQKRKRADILIFTDKGLENTREHVQKIARDLTA